jgi:hypothetical protein
MTERLYNTISQKILSARKPQGEAEKVIPIHTHLHRGWDHSNRRWLRVVWPTLDRKLLYPDEESTAIWRMDWNVGRMVEDTNTEEPQSSSSRMRSQSFQATSTGIGRQREDVTKEELPASSTGMVAEPRPPVEGQTEDIEYSVKLREARLGKRREIGP